MKNRQSGFTMMELLVTVLIAGILIAMAVPSYNRLVNSSRISDRSSEMVSLITFARSEAIKRNARITLCRVASASGNSCIAGMGQWSFWIMLAPTDSTASADGILRRGAFETYNNTLRVRSDDLNDGRILFSPEGISLTDALAVVSGKTFTVCSTRYTNQNQRKMTLGASSRITTVKESVTCT